MVKLWTLTGGPPAKPARWEVAAFVVCFPFIVALSMMIVACRGVQRIVWRKR